MSFELKLGDCLEVLKSMEANSCDSLVTDPPAGISFMGKDWDSNKGGREQWIAWMTEVMTECLRVLKPGAHGFVWALPRTSHWTATALENAGFEVRDVVTHLFGTGFPKSLNLGEGRGTALKPASEHWILVRKKCSEKTVAANVLKHRTGGINIDDCRIGISDNDPNHRKPNANMGSKSGHHFSFGKIELTNLNLQGRFPANLILDEQAAEMLDEQSGQLSQCGGPKKTTHDKGMFGIGTPGAIYREDNRGASRFFYCAKSSKSERNDGLNSLPDGVRQNPMRGSNGTGKKNFIGGFQDSIEKNTHPTVKPLKLMTYLCRMITPPGGTVLDPFMGSGSTGVAAIKEGFQFLGIEQSPEYIEIAQRRIAHGKADQ